MPDDTGLPGLGFVVEDGSRLGSLMDEAWSCPHTVRLGPSAASRNSCWLRRLDCSSADVGESSRVTRRKQTSSISWRDGLMSRVFAGRQGLTCRA